MLLGSIWESTTPLRFIRTTVKQLCDVNFHLGYALSSRTECFGNALTGQVRIQCKILELKGINFYNTSLIKVCSKL